jgi:hypothetical protein
MMVITINDNSGRPHEIKIPNSLFLPDLRVCLLLPQHWAQEARDNHPLPNGTRMENNATNCTLIWGQGKFQKIIPFDSSTNTPIFFSRCPQPPLIESLSPDFKPSRCPSSGGSMSSSTQVCACLMETHLGRKSLWQRRM